jgi:hypothetical protein
MRGLTFDEAENLRLAWLLFLKYILALAVPKLEVKFYKYNSGFVLS